jgi:hypothetical protein
VNSFPTLAAYNACDFNVGTSVSVIGPYTKVITEAPGTVMWFACNVANHCAVFQMKIQITVS